MSLKLKMKSCLKNILGHKGENRKMKLHKKNIMKEAHRLAKKFKNEFPEIDYKLQLGLCMKYLFKKDNVLPAEEEYMQYTYRGNNKKEIKMIVYSKFDILTQSLKETKNLIVEEVFKNLFKGIDLSRFTDGQINQAKDKISDNIGIAKGRHLQPRLDKTKEICTIKAVNRVSV